MKHEPVHAIVLDTLCEDQRMMRSDQDLELSKSISGWRHSPRHPIRIRASLAAVNNAGVDLAVPALTLGCMAALEGQLVDKRIVERNIKKGLLRKEEYEDHLAKLPDRSNDLELVGIPGEEPPPTHGE